MFGNRARDIVASSGESAKEAEFRSDYRAETNGLIATIVSAQGEVAATVHNLSTRGVMASAPNPPAEGEQVVVSIDGLPTVRGQIRWVKDNRFGVLLFTALPVGAFRVADQGRGRRPRPPRYVVRIPVRIEAPGIARSATVQNISQQGMALETGLPVNPGKLLTVLIDGHAPVEGRVRWSRGGRCGLMLTVGLGEDMLEELAQQK